METPVEGYLAGRRIVMLDQCPGIVDQHLRRDAAKVMKGSFQTVKPCALAFMAKSRDKPTPGVAKGRNEQKNPDDLATDRSPRRAEVDLQLPPRRRLKPHAGALLGFQLTPEITNGPLHRAQADPETVLALQLLADHVSVAPVLPQPFTKPSLEPIKSTAPVCFLVRHPRAPAQIALHRVAAAAKLERDPLRPPAQAFQPQHHCHILRRLHQISPRSPCRGKSIPLHCHVPSFREGGSVFVSPGGQFDLSPDTARVHAAWEIWQAGLTMPFTLPEELPPLRLLLVWDNLTGHKTPDLVLWLCAHG